MPVVVSFINFNKAFDSLHQPSLRMILNPFGFPEKVVKAIECIYKNCSCCIWTTDSHGDCFKVLTDICQGYIFSPILFSIAIDWILKEAMNNKGIKWHKGRKLLELDFANDIAALSNSIHDLQELVTSISETAEGLGLSICIKKTKNILIGEQLFPLVITK